MNDNRHFLSTIVDRIAIQRFCGYKRNSAAVDKTPELLGLSIVVDKQNPHLVSGGCSGLAPDSCSDRQGYASLIGVDGSVMELPRIERGYPACRSVARRAHLSAPCITILLCRP